MGQGIFRLFLILWATSQVNRENVIICVNKTKCHLIKQERKGWKSQHVNSTFNNQSISLGFLESAVCIKLEYDRIIARKRKKWVNWKRRISLLKWVLHTSRNILIELCYIQKIISICISCIEMLFFPPTRIVSRTIIICFSQK